MKSLKSAVRIGGGILLVLLGVLGLILPIMPGWIFLIPGLVILGEYFPPVQRLVDWARRKASAVVAGGGEPPPPPPTGHKAL